MDLGSTPGVASTQLNLLDSALISCLFYSYVLLKNQQNTASSSLTPSDDGKLSGKNVIATVSTRRVPELDHAKSSYSEAV